MATVGKLKQIRNGHRLHADKLIKKSDELPKGEKAVEETTILLTTLMKKMEILEKCDADVMEQLTDEVEITEEIENTTEHNDKMFSAIAKTELALKYFAEKGKGTVAKKEVNDDEDDDGQTSTSKGKKSGKISIKLPNLEVGEYDGSHLNWSSFWDKFEVAIDSREDLTDVQKFTYLKSYLVGEAKNAILGLSLDKNNYSKAVEVLKSRFGNKQLRVSAHMKELQTIQSVADINDVVGLRRMYDCIETNIASLKVLGVDIATYGSLLISVMYERLPNELRIKISLEFGNGDWKLETALEVFKSELEARERSFAISGAVSENNDWNLNSGENFSTAHNLQITAHSSSNNQFNNNARYNQRVQGDYRGGRNGQNNTMPHNSNFQQSIGGRFGQSNATPHNSNFQQNSQYNQNGGRDGYVNVVCAFCKGSHLSQRCMTVTSIEARRDIVRRENRCFVCLKQNHMSRDCRLRFHNCVNCNQRHNIALCNQPQQVLGCVVQVSALGVVNVIEDVPPNSVQTKQDVEAQEVIQEVREPVSTAPGENESQTSNVIGCEEGVPESSLNVNEVIQNVAHINAPSKEVVLQYALGTVSHPHLSNKISEGTCIIFDNCSQRTYMREDLHQKLKFPVIRHEQLIIKAFGDKQGSLKSLKVVQANVIGKNNMKVSIEALVVPYICSTLKTPPIPEILERYDYLQCLDLADSPSPEDEVQLLVGMNYYYSIVTGGIRKGPPGHPSAVESILGWMICGPAPVNHTTGGTNETIVQLIDVEEDDQNCIPEECGFEDAHLKLSDDEPVIDEEERNIHRDFEESIQFNGVRYVAKLPFKDPSEFIPDHYKIALKRLQSLHTNLLEKNPELKDLYYKVFDQWESENIIQKVADHGTPGKVSYLPHRPIVRSDRETTKIRPIFDASAHDRGGKSLNDYLHTGPSLLCQISDIIIRAGFKKNIVIADIRQAFLNVEICDEHKDFLRFLLLDRKDLTKIHVYRFNRGVFGVNCLPFILCATIIHHMNEMKTREADLAPLITQFLRDLYMDDETTGVNTIEEGKQFYDFAKKAMAEAGLDLRKWDSNLPELREYMNCVEGKEMKKILGILWNKNDEFVFDFTAVATEASKLEMTKRNVLSFGAKFFDPVGWIAPIIVVARIYYQKICKGKFGWDDAIKDEMQQQWVKYLQALSEIKSIHIPRYMFPSFLGMVESVTLHGYCDSSELAYCAVIYAHVSNGKSSASRLVASKCKVAPIKKNSIPLLEFSSCVLLAELMHKVVKILKDVVIITDKRYWSDSEVAISWIKSDEKKPKLKPAVQRRVRKMKKICDVNNWGYVHTSLNPADIGTREASALTIQDNELWWFGPSLPHDNPPRKSGKEESVDEIEEVVTASISVFVTQCAIGSLINVQRYSSLSKLLRVTAYTIRLAGLIKGKSIQSGEITAEESEKALKLWIKSEQSLIMKEKKFENLKNQLSLFEDGEGILRLKGRLENSHLPYDSKHPIFLNQDSFFTTLVIRDAHHRVKHMRTKSTLNEVRSRFWVCSGKRRVNAAIRGCVICKYINAKPLIGPAPPDLPDYRVAYEFAWQNIGIDYAGPVYVKDIYSKDSTMHKAYICLMTCAATRNVHIELVPDMSAPALIRCLKRFIGRRGKFHMAVSDNFKSFVGKDLQRFLASEGINWTHILPKSPWWGAFYERLIRIMKEGLKKSLGNAKLTYEELETVLIEIESIINSRPLTYLFEDESEEALTPSHLAIGKRLISPIGQSNHADVTHESVTARYKYLQRIIEHYWKRFSKEYLLELHQHHVNVHKGNYDELCKLLLNDVVLIKDDASKRNCWKKGKVEQLIPGADGRVRGAVLRTITSGRVSYIRRPVQKLIPLEVQREQSVDPHSSVSERKSADADNAKDDVVTEAVDVVAKKDDVVDARSSPDVSKRGRIRFPTDRFGYSTV